MANLKQGIESLMPKSYYYYDEKRRKDFDNFLNRSNDLLLDANNIDFLDKKELVNKQLMDLFKLENNQASNILDSYITKTSYDKNWGLNNKVGIWTANKYIDDAQKEAKKLQERNPGAYDVMYGIRHSSDKGQGYGLTKPFIIGEGDYENIVNSFNSGNRANKNWQFYSLRNMKGR